MATNFRISAHQNSESLHLRLMGDFDGTSAHELLNILRRNCKGDRKVFVHTNALREVYPFACGVFHSQIGSIRAQFKRLVFTGEHADKIAAQ